MISIRQGMPRKYTDVMYLYQDSIYIRIRNQTYTGHYTVQIHRCPYTFVYVSVHVIYTGSSYHLIFVSYVLFHAVC